MLQTLGRLSLQELLDLECLALSEAQCQQGQLEHCSTPASRARLWGPSGAPSCFVAPALDLARSGLHCLGNCGEAVFCRGPPSPGGAPLLPLPSELQELLHTHTQRCCQQHAYRVNT